MCSSVDAVDDVEKKKKEWPARRPYLYLVPRAISRSRIVYISCLALPRRRTEAVLKHEAV